MPRVVRSWARNYVAVNAVYFTVGGLWAYYIYWVFGAVLFAPGAMPSWADMGEQMRVSSRMEARLCARHPQLTMHRSTQSG